jgi:gluconokinase
MMLVVMGVSGSGKTTVGRILAQRLGWPFYDADEYHPARNVEKMRSGVPLTDTDRWPWLDALNALLRGQQAQGASAVLGCSALKQIYRERLAEGIAGLRWVHLHGPFELIQSRLQARKGHYMPAHLLESQFETLEPPSNALAIDVAATPEALAERIVREVTGRPPV